MTRALRARRRGCSAPEERASFFWFDILGGALLSRDGDRPLRWELGELASAAGWIDREHLLVASETGLWRFGIATGQRELVAALPNEGGRLRSNDGRADPWGGFWIGMMGKKAEAGAGGIWRACGAASCAGSTAASPSRTRSCFDAGRERAYFADTRAGTVWRSRSTPGPGGRRASRGRSSSWRRRASIPMAPSSTPRAGSGMRNGRAGSPVTTRTAWFVRAEPFEATRTSCPAFGGAGLDRLVRHDRAGGDGRGRASSRAAGRHDLRRATSTSAASRSRRWCWGDPAGAGHLRHALCALRCRRAARPGGHAAAGRDSASRPGCRGRGTRARDRGFQALRGGAAGGDGLGGRGRRRPPPAGADRLRRLGRRTARAGPARGTGRCGLGDPAAAAGGRRRPRARGLLRARRGCGRAAGRDPERAGLLRPRADGGRDQRAGGAAPEPRVCSRPRVRRSRSPAWSSAPGCRSSTVAAGSSSWTTCGSAAPG